MNKAFGRSFKNLYFKYRGGHRVRYAFEPISRLLIVFDLILLAFLFSASNLQSFVVSAWAFAQFMFVMIASPYNRCVRRPSGTCACGCQWPPVFHALRRT